MPMCTFLLPVALLLAGCQTKGVPPADTVEVGDARFTSHSITVEAPAMAAGDFDGDGHQDLVTAGEPQLTVFRGDGTGELVPSGRVAAGQQPDDFAIADLDSDGDLDIAVANHETHYLTTLLGDGRGGFEPAANSPLRIGVRPHPHAVRAVDLDADGHIDLIVDHREGEGLLILRGLGGGRFASPGTLVEAGGDPYRGMAVGDIDGDGRPDMVTPNPRDVGVLLNRTDEQIAFVQARPVAATAPFAVEVGDFDGDGLLDLMVASGEGSEHVELFLGDGRGGFEESESSPFSIAPGGKMIAVGDFNGDGIADAAVASYQSSKVLVLLGGRDSIHTGHLPAGEHPWGLVATDLNEDGKDDLIVADDANPRAVVYLSVAP
jgi:hypothetical protein